jgi:hypothetical protein
MLASCTPQFNEEFYKNGTETKRVIELSALMRNGPITQLVRMNEHVIIINGVIINTSTKTFGIPPKGGYSEAFFKSASSKEYSSWGELINTMPDKNIPSETRIEHLLKLMADSGFKEYHYDNSYAVHAFQSGSNVLRGFYGILIGIEASTKEVSTRENYAYINKITDNIYYFEFR